ncbi:hypothetical protein HOG48_04585 [Candidatus Peregrinibacteria bacterium]|jgi:hypothetical protein|nr:hypothetical protein [Candidatus Peregrinibacteria bacterium]
MNFDYSDEFLKDFKKLKKKFPSLDGDLKNFEKFVAGVDFDNNNSFVVLVKDDGKGVKIIKTRLMVRSLKGKSKTRLIFSFCLREGSIYFIEIYLKNQKNREDTERIDDYLNSL